jgi:enamine deaminase RidA (YjgF/YER057c/UK114 family)
VRSAFFEKNGVFDGLLPASTVIGAASHPGAALVAGLLAIQPKTSVLRVAAVPSPLQREPINYGSAFSRAAELDFGDHRRLTVSGTASIDAGGRTVCVNDVEAQMATAMKVVAALLASRRMGWGNVTRCVAYFRRPADTRLFARACEVNSVGALPAIISHHTICRDDLLFEMEVDAVTANS